MRLKLTILGTLWITLTIIAYFWFGLTFIHDLDSAYFFFSLGLIFPAVLSGAPFVIYSLTEGK